MEVDALKSEIDRISTATEYNGMQLLDGSLSGKGSSSNYGAIYGMNELVTDIGGGRISTESSVAGMKITFTTGASGNGGENAVWIDGGMEVQVNLVENKSYTDAEINELIKNATVPKDAGMTAPVGTISFKSEYGVITAAATSTTETVAGIRDTAEEDISALVADGSNGGIGSSDKIKFTANSYGATALNESLFEQITLVADVAKGKENVTIEQPTKVSDGQAAQVTLHLATGVKYSEKDIENLSAEAGYDYAVELSDDKNPDGANDGYLYINVANESVDIRACLKNKSCTKRQDMIK